MFFAYLKTLTFDLQLTIDLAPPFTLHKTLVYELILYRNHQLAQE